MNASPATRRATALIRPSGIPNIFFDHSRDVREHITTFLDPVELVLLRLACFQDVDTVVIDGKFSLKTLLCFHYTNKIPLSPRTISIDCVRRNIDENPFDDVELLSYVPLCKRLKNFLPKVRFELQSWDAIEVFLNKCPELTFWDDSISRAFANLSYSEVFQRHPRLQTYVQQAYMIHVKLVSFRSIDVDKLKSAFFPQTAKLRFIENVLFRQEKVFILCEERFTDVEIAQLRTIFQHTLDFRREEDKSNCKIKIGIILEPEFNKVVESLKYLIENNRI